jgi:hypothetical protein
MRNSVTYYYYFGIGDGTPIPHAREMFGVSLNFP